MHDDSAAALVLNPNYFRAHLRIGEALVELGKLPKEEDVSLIDKGIKSL